MNVHQQAVLRADYIALEHLLDRIADTESSACTDEGVADLAVRHERAVRRMESIGNRRILDVSDRDAFRISGCQSMSEFVATALRITHPKKRLRAVEALESMHAMTGEKMAPVCPNTARELASGAIGADHVNVVLDVMARIPATVTPERREFAEKSLAEYATTLTPRKLTAAGVRILAHLDPDGTLTDDRDRARNRKLTLGCQDSQLMSKLSATLDPTTRALFDVVLAAWAAPGMNNPDEEDSPRGDKKDTDSDTVREAAARDHRSQPQRNHDALAALLRSAVDGGLLGTSHRGLPPHVIISMTETQLRERAGVVRTATGTDLPISDALTLAAVAQMHLAVFDDHTDEALFYGRSRRLASQAQRFVAFAKYRGCSKGDCTVPFAHTEMHHAETDWANGGLTDCNHLAPACGPHNRAVGPEPYQWTTEKIADGPDRGRYGWRRNADPPDRLRANHLHRIDEILERHRAPHDSSRGDEPHHDVVTPLPPPGFDIVWPAPTIQWAA